MTRAVAWIIPSVMGLMKLVWLASPIAILPSGMTAKAVPSEARLSAIDA